MIILVLYILWHAWKFTNMWFTVPQFCTLVDLLMTFCGTIYYWWFVARLLLAGQQQARQLASQPAADSHQPTCQPASQLSDWEINASYPAKLKQEQGVGSPHMSLVVFRNFLQQRPRLTDLHTFRGHRWMICVLDRQLLLEEITTKQTSCRNSIMIHSLFGTYWIHEDHWVLKTSWEFSTYKNLLLRTERSLEVL